MSFDEIFSSTYHRIVDEVAPGKPMMIGEVGSTENGGSKAAWIAEMLRELPISSQSIRGLIWFDKWRRRRLAAGNLVLGPRLLRQRNPSPSYLPNSFGSLGPGTVPVPG